MPTELQPMTARLNEMLARLESVFQQRKQFLADAAHELRTPTAALLTTLELALRRPRDQAELVEALQNGLADARRLRKLVENLMEQARSEHARATDITEPLDGVEVVRDCISVVAPLAAEKQIRLIVEPELPEALPLLSQRERLRSILLNVLGNSIEYTSIGGEVRMSCRRENDQLRVTIRDTGRGISAEQLPLVFEPFYRGGQSRQDDASHLGLGLFLVKSHVKALGGQCHIESRLGEGTSLHIIVPAPIPPAFRPGDSAESMAPSPATLS